MESVDDEGVIADATPVQDEGLSPYKAQIFAERWKDATDEKQEGQSFWRDFFIEVVGLSDLREAGIEFEKRVISSKKGTTNYIDVFFKDIALIEHKSAGKNLDIAEEQAREYIVSLPPALRPPVIIISDFARIRIVEYLVNKSYEFPLIDLPNELDRIEAIFSGHATGVAKVEISADQKAAKLMADLYTEFEANGYEGHQASVFMMRVLFLLFGDDTRMWRQGLFNEFIRDTNEEGSDVGARLQALFQLLDTPLEQRPRLGDEKIKDFPYVNGGLFKEQLQIFFFTRKMRQALLDCSSYDWSDINPTILGTMLQSIADKEQRHQSGSHFTSEENILKAINPLFMDELNERLTSSWDSVPKLKSLQHDLGKFNFLDPAAGSANFLLVAYKALRGLELEIIKRIRQLEGTSGELHFFPEMFLSVQLEMFHAIEYEEWSSQIATVSLFLAERQCNQELEKVLGSSPPQFPISHSATIVQGNALELDWKTICPMNDNTIILGNPPFLGSNWQTPEQKADQNKLWGGKKGSASLDYVANWYLVAARNLQGTKGRAAFVSTNSITQGEQPSILWSSLYELGFDIDFAHRTFAWSNDASGQANVHCVIIGFSQNEKPKHLDLWFYETPQSQPELKKVASINAYLTDAPKVLISPRSKPLKPSTPPMRYGNMPNEFGFLANIYEEDLEHLRQSGDNIALKYIRPLIGANEMLNNKPRYCLWLVRAEPSEMDKSPFIRERIAGVKKLRSESNRKATVELAKTPYLFQEVREQTGRYLAVPIVSSGNREYIPMKMFDPEVIPTNALLTIPEINIQTFAILQSKFFSVWMRAVAGRLKNDYRISAEITYNNFPFPDLTAEQAEKLAETGQSIVDARSEFPASSLAELYKPTIMPKVLVVAHANNDKAVASIFGLKATATEADILASIFAEYARQSSEGSLI